MKWRRFLKNDGFIKMFSIERWSLKFITHIIVIFATLVQVKKASTLCIEGSQYYNDVEKICFPCTICTSPNIVITPCSDFSNTLCGLPKFGKNLDLVGISQEKIPKRKELSQKREEKKSKKNRFKRLRKKKYSKKGKRYKNFKKFKRKLNANSKANVSDLSTSLLDKKNATILTLSSNKDQEEHLEYNKKEAANIERQNLEGVMTENVQLLVTTENVELPHETEYVELPITTELVQSTVFTENYESNKSATTEDKKKGFSVTNVGKYVVLSAVGTANILLLLVAIGNIISCICRKKREKEKRKAFFYNQNLPNPSQKPVKCRFTAVLPSKSSSPQYANVDSYLKPIISSSSSCEASDDSPPTSDNSCSTVLSHSTSSQVNTRPDNINSSSSNIERDSSVREPLINATSNPEVIESASTIQLYSRMPSPNPFTMDRLLESRRAVGYPSVENNLYVETWCSSPSPVLPRSQDSSVTPSPATCLRKPFSTYSSSSSPLTTRTFRATPAFSSFQPLRL